MKKLFVALVFIGLSGLYVFNRPQITALTGASNSSISGGTVAPNTANSMPAINIRRGEDGGEGEGGITITQVPAPTPVPAPKQVPTQMPMKPMMSGYKDGVYTGSVADAYYGLVQVKATIVNGRITDVAFLQYPSDRSTSRYINGQAMPMLTQEAIQAQSANVNIISGASATSGAFQQSLASALALAKY